MAIKAQLFITCLAEQFFPDVLKRMAEFIEKRFPQHKEAFVEILAPFGKELSSTYQQ